MFIGDEREIVHLQADWSIVLTALLWVWLSLTVTVLAVREQFRRQKAANLEREEKDDNISGRLDGFNHDLIDLRSRDSDVDTPR